LIGRGGEEVRRRPEDVIMLRRVAVVLVLWSYLAAPEVHAETAVWSTCGPFEGVSHVVQGRGTSNVEVGGQMAAIAGETRLVHDPDRGGQPFDVVRRGEDGQTSLAATDARLVSVETDEGGVVLVAIFADGVVETFHFLDATLVYTQLRHDDGRIATSTYVAACTRSR
jgi:hypothetical protein